jgi:precorrin-6Y C5,15-methyltransferase (decarboxylating)
VDSPVVDVVGIGADGWPGLGAEATRRLLDAEVVFGGGRQLALLPASVEARRVPWPSPLLPALPGLLEAHRHRRCAVLASGDPTFHGIGSTLVRLLGAERVRILPQPSSAALARARLGWSAADVEVVSLVNAPVELLHPVLAPGRRLLVLSAGEHTPAAVADLLQQRGFGASELTVLEQLGGPAERVLRGSADDWPHPPGDPLNLVAVRCAGTGALSRVPGLPDDRYESDGQLTKREVRAVTLARLAPLPGQLLWDVGAGSGSIAIEWSRVHPSCRAIAIEPDRARAQRISVNAAGLGVPGLRVVEGRAPEALAGLPAPDTVFVGGGATVPGVVEAGWEALRPGGRLVLNAVTIETEQVLTAWYARLGGELSRLSVSRAAPVGGFTGWRTMMPVTQLEVIKPMVIKT